MKNFIKAGLFVIVVILASCAKESFSENIYLTTKAYTFEAEHTATTKTIIKDETAVYWSPNDSIRIFYGSQASGKFISESSIACAKASFTGTFDKFSASINAGIESSCFWGVYPYSDDSVCYDDAVSVQVPSVQTAEEGTFSPGLFPAIAKSTGLSLAFYNVCGGIMFTVSRQGIVSVSFKGRGNEDIAGVARVGVDENNHPVVESFIDGAKEITVNAPDDRGFIPGIKYYLVAFPQSFTDGIDFTYHMKYAEGTYSIKSELQIKRSTFAKLQEKDKEIEVEPIKGNISFSDNIAKSACVEKFDKDHDGEVSYAEAYEVSSLKDLFENHATVQSFEEIKYFTNVTNLEGCFYGCVNIKSVTIPGNITEIGNNAFRGCISLEPIKIPASVLSFGVKAFNGCSKLKEFVIPSSVSEIGAQCFDSSINTIIMEGNTPPSIDEDSFVVGTVFYVPDSAVDTYKNKRNWALHANYIFSQATPKLILSAESLEFGSTASSQNIQLTCNRDWKVSSTLPDWIEVSPKEGKASASAVEIKVNVTENTGFLRTAEIVFNGGTQAKKTLQVYQAAGIEPTSIKEVKAMMTDASGTTLPENTIIVGTIVSNSSLDNLTSSKIAYIQDGEAGIQLIFAAKHSFSFGDVVSVDVSGLTIKKYAEQYYIEAIPLDKASKITSTTVEPKEVEVADFLANKYEGMYISIKQPCQVTDADLSKTWVVSSKATSINILAQTGETFVVRSGQYSSFGSSTVPTGSGKIAGISTIYNDALQLVFAQNSDYAGLTGERFTITTPEITSSDISVILQASQGAKVTLQNATVVATAITNPATTPNNTFLVTDAGKTNHLLIYDCDASGIKVGDNITAAGTLSTYSGGTGNTKQVTGATVTINSSSTYTQPEPTDITSTFDSFDVNQKNVYVSFKGTYTKSGSYCNISVSGATTHTGSILTPDAVDLTGLENVPNVTFTGYYLYKTGGKYLYFILTKAEKGTDYLSR